MRTLIGDLNRVLAEEPLDLARAALTVARLEYPNLGFSAPLATLDRLGARAAARLNAMDGAPLAVRVAALNTVLFEEERFAGNRARYDDFRNSCINAVLDRRLGIPITLALIYMEVARRAGVTVLGVGFPGHFLMRVPADTPNGRDLILDPFNGGASIDAEECRALLARQIGGLNEDVPLDPTLLQPCAPRHMLARMLNNLKRTYIELRSFPQARRVTDLLLTVDPTLVSEVRDRGLLAFQLDDFPAALRDLENYLWLGPKVEDPSAEERRRVWNHVKALRRRVASLN